MSQPISMPWSAPVFPQLPHSWQGVRMVVFPFAPRPGAVERILPPGMQAAAGPGTITLIDYPATEWQHAFKELVVLVPVQVDDTLGSYVPYIYVNTDEALIPGREIAGFPKLLADVEWERDGSRFRGSATRWGVTFFSIEGEIRGPMPEPPVEEAPLAPPPSLNYKLIPDPAGGIAIEQITSTRLEIVPRERELGQAKIRCRPSEFDAVAELVPDAEGPMIVLLSDNTIPAGEVLKEIKREEGV
jgi:acetoacetate decarboxylase